MLFYALYRREKIILGKKSKLRIKILYLSKLVSYNSAKKEKVK